MFKINNDSEKIINAIFDSSIFFRKNIEKKELEYINKKLKKSKIINKNEYLSNPVNNAIIPYDCPDLVIIFDDFVLAVEHFMVDMSKLTKKGYKFKKVYTEKYFEKKHEKNIKEKINNIEFSKFTEEIITELKFNHLIDNFKKCFENHYKQVELYKKSIREKFNINKKIYLVFFVEYNLIFPSCIEYDGELKGILPHNDISFYEFLSDKNKIDGLLVHVKKSNLNKNFTRYFSGKSLINNKYDINNIEIFDISKVNIYEYSKPILIDYLMKGKK